MASAAFHLEALLAVQLAAQLLPVGSPTTFAQAQSCSQCVTVQAIDPNGGIIQNGWGGGYPALPPPPPVGYPPILPPPVLPPQPFIPPPALPPPIPNFPPGSPLWPVGSPFAGQGVGPFQNACGNQNNGNIACGNGDNAGGPIGGSPPLPQIRTLTDIRSRARRPLGWSSGSQPPYVSLPIPSSPSLLLLLLNLSFQSPTPAASAPSAAVRAKAPAAPASCPRSTSACRSRCKQQPEASQSKSSRHPLTTTTLLHITARRLRTLLESAPSFSTSTGCDRFHFLDPHQAPLFTHNGRCLRLTFGEEGSRGPGGLRVW